MVNVRPYKDEDYHLLCEWFKAYDWDEWDKRALSPKGFIGEYDNVPMAYGSYYPAEGCQVSFLGFFVVNQNADRSERQKCLRAILDHIFKDSGKIGKTFVTYSTDSKFMVDLLTKEYNMHLFDGDTYIMSTALDGSSVEFMD